MVRIKALDVLRDFGRPFSDGGSWARFAARFISKLPGKDGGRLLVAGYEGFDVFLVCLLCRGSGVPGCSIVPECVCIRVADSSIVAPIIHEWENQLDTESLRSRHDIIEALDTIRAIIDVGTSRVQNLEVHKVGIGISRWRGCIDR